MEAPIITCSDNWSSIEEQGMPAPRARSRTSSSERFVREILFDGPIDAEETELFTSMVNLKIAEDSPIAFAESMESTRSRTSSDEVFVQGILSPSQDMLDEPTYHDQGDKLMKHFDNLKTSGNNEYAPTVASTSPASTCRSTCDGERSVILVDLNHETYDWKNYLEDPSPESTKLKFFRPTKKLKPPKPKPSDAVCLLFDDDMADPVKKKPKDKKLKPPKPKPSDAVCLLFVDDMADPVKKKPKDKVSPAARLALGNVVTYASKRDQPVDYAKIFQDEGQIVAPSSAGIRGHQMYCREEDINLSVIPSTPSSVAPTHYSLDANQLHNGKYEPSHNHNDQLKRGLRRPSRFVRPKCPTRKAPAKPKRAPRRTTLKRAERQVYKPTKEDILCGRGGMTNKHPGNIRFRELVASAKNEYSLLGNKRKEKKQFSEGILRVIAEYGGRFLQKKGDNWIIVREAAARTKCSQALRE